MSPSRETGPVSVARSPLDLAITAAIDGDNEGALRHAGAILEEDPTRSIAVLLAGRTLGILGHTETAALAKEQEEAQLYAAMQSEIVMQVLRRLAGAPKP